MFNETAYDLAVNAGCSPDAARVAAAIAQAESSGNPGSYNPETAAGTPSGKGSYGLWQIYLKAHPEFAGQNLYDPAANAAAMFAVSSGCSNWRPWSTFNSGAYQRYLQASPVASSGPSSDDSMDGRQVNALPSFLETLTEAVPFFSGAPSWLPIAALAVAAYFLLK